MCEAFIEFGQIKVFGLRPHSKEEKKMSVCTCGKSDPTIACGICRQPTYCCQGCERLGWSVHQDLCNVHIADKPNTTVFTPHVEYDPKKIDGTEEFVQSHIVRYVSPKAVVEEHLIDADFKQTIKKFGGGAPIDEDSTYELQISGGGIIPKRIPVIPVFKGARDPRADALAKMATLDMSKVVFWSSDGSNFNIPTSGELVITLFVNGKETNLNIVGDYKLPSSETLWGNWSRKFSSFLLKKEYETKGFSHAAFASLVTMRGSNRTGSTFRFTVKMTKGKGGSSSAPVIDVEFACRLTDFERGEWINGSAVCARVHQRR